MNKKGSKKVSAERVNQPPRKHKKPKPKWLQVTGKVAAVVGKAFATLFLVGVITGCIVVTALTVYVLKFADQNDYIDIRNYKMEYSTILYANDKDGNPVEIQKLQRREKREWVDLKDIPEHVQNAFIYTEDKRFKQHEGVDWKRTFASFANLFLHFYDTKAGGSTITQQTVRAITKDNDVNIQRKIREIFRAINMERKFSKDEILECYLNIIFLGGNNYGVQAASKYYFGKDVKDITIAEAAALAASAQNPNNRNPMKNPEGNKTRRNNYTLKEMYEAGVITQEEYEKALNEELKIVGKSESSKSDTSTKKYQSYFVDHVINQVIADLVEKYGYNEEYAEEKLYTEGYHIYTTMDPDIQNQLEKKYVDPLTFYSKSKVKDPPQSAMIVLDYNGQLKGVVGGRGQKAGNRVLNRATQSKLGIGSSIKPLSAYALALEKNLINYSSIIKDEPTIRYQDGKMGPQNVTKKYYGNVTVEYAVRVSLNTIPVKLIRELTPKTSFEFMQNKLGISTLVKSRKVTFDNGTSTVYSDLDLARLGMGSLVDGVRLSELAAAYQVFGNGGYYNEMTCYTKVTNASETEVILENKPSPVRAISEETATVMNRLLQRVVEGPSGTGRDAKLSTQTVVGKTGTANDGKNRIFVGLTPYHVSAVWVGYDTPKEIKSSVVYKPAKIWKNVMADIYKKLPKKEFELSDSVKELKYCTSTGLIAGSKCPSTQVGYYKSDNIPEVCTTHN